MAFSTLFGLDSAELNTEAEVETRLLAKIFADLGYPDKAILPKKHIPALIINDGVKSLPKEVDFLLKDSSGTARIIVEAKDPSISILSAWGQAASYALSYNKDKKQDKRINWLLISNGHETGLFPHDSNSPIVLLQLSDFASGMPPYVTLRTYIKYEAVAQPPQKMLSFCSLPPHELNQLFETSHNLVWKKEKLAPADAFFEFCKFIFIKIQEDKKREKLPANTHGSKIPLTMEWLDYQKSTCSHPVRDILFANLHKKLEDQIIKEDKKRIFEPNETLKLSASTCKDLVELFQSVNLSTIDEDLNGRMFEVFLTASIRGKDLGQFFTPRSVVDFMTRIALRKTDQSAPPKVLDACCGTAGFLIEVMAYLIGRLRNDSRLTNTEKEKIRKKICNESLYGVEANERVSRIARINMYLHGDGGSHIFHSDGLDVDPQEQADMSLEQREEVKEYKEKVQNESFDIILTNPPFSMVYDAKNDDEKRILRQHRLTECASSAKSSILFLDRYYELLKPSGELIIVLDDTVLNGKSYEDIREWILSKFIILGVHSLPFNAFFKAKANIKTSILHLRKKVNSREEQGTIFMSIANNVGHDNSLNDTPNRNNLIEILTAYTEWQRTGILETTVKNNADPNENLECPMQYWLVPAERLTTERFDAFFYAPELWRTYQRLIELQRDNKIRIVDASRLNLRQKITRADKYKLRQSGEKLKYFEIGYVTQNGLITKYDYAPISELPSRAEYQLKKGDILVALNNSSRGTVVLVPDEYDGALCTSGFLVIVPQSPEEGFLLWYSLRSEICKRQIYYLAQTASQPELKIEAWNNYFKIPMPVGREEEIALQKSKEFFDMACRLLSMDKCRLSI